MGREILHGDPAVHHTLSQPVTEARWTVVRTAESCCITILCQCKQAPA